MNDHDERGLAVVDPDDEMTVLKNEPAGLSALNRSELETQLDAAHRYPRSVSKFVTRAQSLATRTLAIAESCIYSLPRGGKPITGPSVRLAEICASTYGNLHVGARPVDVARTYVVSQGIAWDLETNYRVTIEVKRRTTGRDGKVFNDDMVGVTHAAATAIAYRNAVFKVIPRSYIDEVYAKVKLVAVGDAKTLDAKRAELFDRLLKMGVTADRVLAAVGKIAVGDVGLDDVETIIGLGTAVKSGDKSLDEAFPPAVAPVPTAAPGQEGRRIPLGSRGRRRGAPQEPNNPDGGGEGVDNPVDDAGDAPGPGSQD